MAQTININDLLAIPSNYDPPAEDAYLHSDKFKQWLISQGYNRELVDKYPEEYYYIDWYLSHHSFIYDYNHGLEETLWFFYDALGCNEDVIVDYFITDWPNEKPSYIKKTLKNLKTKGQYFYYKQLDPQDIDDILGWNYIKSFAAYFTKQVKECVDALYNSEHNDYMELSCKTLNDVFEIELYKAGLHDLYYSNIKYLDILKERTFTLEYNPIAVINQNNYIEFSDSEAENDISPEDITELQKMCEEKNV